MSQVAIFWHYSACGGATSVSGCTTANDIRTIAHRFGAVRVFKAYFEASQDLSSRARSFRAELQSSGVSLTECPQDDNPTAIDQMLTVDMIVYGMESIGASTIILIAGSHNFSYAVSTLRQRKHNVVLICDDRAHPNMKAQASECIDLNSVIPQVVVPDKDTPAQPPNADAGPSSGGFQRMTDSKHFAFNAGAPSWPFISQQRYVSQPDDLHSRPLLPERVSPVTQTVVASPHPPIARPLPSYTSGSLWDPMLGSTSSASSATSIPPLRHSNSSSLFGSSLPPTGSQPNAELVNILRGRQQLQSSPTSLSSVISQAAYTAPSLAGQIERRSPPKHDMLGTGFLSSDSESTLGSSSTNLTPKTSIDSFSGWLPPDTPASESNGTLGASVKGFPMDFSLIARLLENSRLKGSPRPLRSLFAIELVTNDPDVYKRAGVEKFKQYAALAEAAGVVELGGNGGNAWISIHPDWKGTTVR